MPGFHVISQLDSSKTENSVLIVSDELSLSKNYRMSFRILSYGGDDNDKKESIYFGLGWKNMIKDNKFTALTDDKVDTNGLFCLSN